MAGIRIVIISCYLFQIGIQAPMVEDELEAQRLADRALQEHLRISGFNTSDQTRKRLNPDLDPHQQFLNSSSWLRWNFVFQICEHLSSANVWKVAKKDNFELFKEKNNINSRAEIHQALLLYSYWESAILRLIQRNFVLSKSHPRKCFEPFVRLSAKLVSYLILLSGQVPVLFNWILKGPILWNFYT